MTKKRNAKKQNKWLLSFVFALIITLLIATVAVLAVGETKKTVSITYTPGTGTGSNINVSTEYDSRLYSALLSDYGKNGTESWSHSKIQGTYTDAGGTTRTAEYTAAFAGWRLAEINGEAYTGKTYFYPDNDFVYLNDEPFASYIASKGEITSLEFEALWGKTVYLRDKYNFKNIKNVYGVGEVPNEQGIYIAKIDWDTGKQYASNFNSGATQDSPVATLGTAEEIIGSSGGKIAVVEHFTFEEFPDYYLDPDKLYYTTSTARDAALNAEYNKYLADNGLTEDLPKLWELQDKHVTMSTATIEHQLGSSVTNGVLTITGEGLGGGVSYVNGTSGATVENRSPAEAGYYENAHFFYHDNRGTGACSGEPSKSYPHRNIRFNFVCDVVLEGMQFVGYREKLNILGTAEGPDIFFVSKAGKHFLIEDDFRIYQRNGRYGSVRGMEITNWSYGAVSISDGTYSTNAWALASGGTAMIRFMAGKGATADTNVYQTVRGDGSATAGAWQITALFETERAHNVHQYIYGYTSNKQFSLFYTGSQWGVANQKADFAGIYLGNIGGDYEICYNNRAYDHKYELTEGLTVVYDDPNNGSRKTESLYLGGVHDSSEGTMSFIVPRIDFHMDGGKIKTLYGGGSSMAFKQQTDVISFTVNGGSIDTIYGGGLGGYIGTDSSNTDITMNLYGGTIANVYGGGAGGDLKLFDYNTGVDLTNNYTVDNQTKPQYSYSASASYPLYRINHEIGGGSTTPATGGNHTVYTVQPYTVDGITFTAILVTNTFDDGGKGDLSQYYVRQRGYAVSDALLQGNITINLDGATVTGNLIAGGQSGAVKGNTEINIKSGKVNGNVFGGGEGNKSEFNLTVPNTGDTGLKLRKAFIFTKDTGKNYEEISQEIINDLSKDYQSYKQFVDEQNSINGASRELTPYYLYDELPEGNIYIKSTEVARMGQIDGNTSVNISGGTISGSVFGGSYGSIASVTGNSEVNIVGGQISGNAYGGGNLGEVEGNVTVSVGGTADIRSAVYGGANQSDIGGEVNLKISGGNIKNAYGGNNASGSILGDLIYVEMLGGTVETLFGGGNEADYGGSLYTLIDGGKITGTAYGGANKADIGGEILIAVDGGEVATLYGANNESGEILGDVYVELCGGRVGTLFGGGNKAAYTGNLNTLIEGGTADYAYGGANEAKLTGNVFIEFTGGTVLSELYGGSNKADITGDVKLTIDGGVVGTATVEGGKITAVTGDAYGGNNTSGTIFGKINTTLKSGTVNRYLFGGGNMADYGGVTNLVIDGGNVGYPDTPQVVADKSVQSCAFGGGNQAVVGATKLTVNGGTMRALVGGSLSADISGDSADAYGSSVTVYLTGKNPTEITTFMAGNDQSGDITGNIRVVVGIEEENLLVPGTEEINYTAANPDENIKITNFFGGGNSADYTYGKDWVIPEVNPGRESPIVGYKGITITVLSGTVYQIFGGGVMADVSNVRTAIYGGEYHFIYGGGFMGYTRTTVTNLRGGNVSGDFLVYGDAALPTAEQGGYVFGGGYNGYTTLSIVNVEQLADRSIHIDHSVFAGGNGSTAGTGYSKVTMINGTVAGSVYGGGYSANAGVNPDGSIPEVITDMSGEAVYAIKDKYGEYLIDVAGNYRDACAVVELTGGAIGLDHATDPEHPYIGNVYGGGYKGITTETHVDIMSYIRDESIKIQLGGNVYGGGHEGDVVGDTHIHFFKGEITGNIYGGGRDGNIYGEGTYIYMLAGVLHGSLYGGGLNGTAVNTNIIISDKIGEVRDYLQNPEILAVIESLGLATEDLVTTIGGSVYGGGEGEAATVYGSTFVRINLEHFIGDTALQGNESDALGTTVSYITGSVYGGGDLGAVGAPEALGGTSVTVQDGLIHGSIYGGGNGERSGAVILADGLGVVYGETAVNIWGGEINGNIYGGGNQGNVGGAHIDIMAFYDSETQSYVIIHGSVFGGGRNGNVESETHIHLFEGIIEGSLYGGGENGYIFGETYVYMLAGTLYGSLYGGGFNGTVSNTNVIVSDKIDEAEATGSPEILEAIGKLSLITSDLKTIIYGSVYGGGEGVDATVFGKTYVKINLENIIEDEGKPHNSSDSKAPISWIEGNVFGGGNLGAVGTRVYPNGETLVVIKDGWIKSSVYAGGNGVPLTGQVYRDGMGAVYGIAHIDLYGGQVDGSVFGGGLRGSVNSSHVDIMAYYNYTIQNILIIAGDVYAGGEEGDILGDTKLHYFIGEVRGSLFGGGYNGDVLGTAYVYMFAGHLYGNLYGGGYNGKVNATKVTVIDDLVRIKQEGVPEVNETIDSLGLTDAEIYITVDGSVFGGGKGSSADVLTKTEVIINMNYGFAADETPTDTSSEASSGQISTVITPNDSNGDGVPDDRGVIGGSVFGGGDLGAVGQGSINTSTNTAEITSAGSTSVIVRSGHILGSVFGSGSGIPPADVVYSLSMGAVLGRTNVLIEGGYIEGSVYGGGTQSRVYAELGDIASYVNIKETAGRKIAIGGSVFGGGDRGSDKKTNASVPTTIGDVFVEITGLPEAERDPANSTSKIYFVGKIPGQGGVYGDGNFCLVNGKRTIIITNLNTGDSLDGGVISLKTFYSLQRADEVYLDNSAIVLLGALDLVDEGDEAIYSINRVNKIFMQNGSTFKLDRLVKYLAELESDYETDRVFVNKGNNGSNRYNEQSGTAAPENPLTKEEIEAYRASLTIKKNTVCVANGLYLEIMNEDGEYGPVFGLFTLELLKAIPGEGGGFVYADIEASTGDFVCQTKRGYVYEAITYTMSEETFNAGTYYERVIGQGYAIANTYSPDTLYYTRKLYDTYMDVSDDVGGFIGSSYTFYFWFIKGPTVTYTGTVTGYIGSDSESFNMDKTIPNHDGTSLNYVLFGLSANDILKSAVTGGKYTLVDTSSNLTGQQIAVELVLGATSLGFLVYDSAEDKWGLSLAGGNVFGYQGITGTEAQNTLAELEITNANNKLSFVLHKAKSVNAELTDMNIVLEIDLIKADQTLYTDGTSTLIFDIDIAIVRMVPVQSLFTETNKGFAGVFTQQIIKITGQSAFTSEYQTRYIPSAFPNRGGYEMTWLLTTVGYKYYMDDYGHYLTVDENGTVVNISPSFVMGDSASPMLNQIYLKDDGNYYCRFANSDEVGGISESLLKEYEDYTSTASSIPVNTKIIMIDLTDGNPKYYYYIVRANADNSPVRSIDLFDFLLMGTSKAIRNLTEAEKPAFIKEYEKNAASRMTERLIFVTDFSDVEWAADFTGEIGLKHMYGLPGKQTDIMDYVKTTTEEDKTIYERFAPESTNYEVKKNDTGLVGWEAKFEKEEYLDKTEDYYDKDIAKLIVNFDINNEWINTKLGEGNFSLKIELLDEASALLEDGLSTTFPVGMAFIYNGKTYHPGIGRHYAVIPLENVGTHEIEIENLLYSLKDLVDTVPDDGEIRATFRVTLYSSPDADYYDSLATTLTQTDYYKIKENPIYSVMAKTAENALYAPGELVNINLSVGRLGEEIRETGVRVLVKKKNEESAEFESVNWNHIFRGQEIESVSARTQALKWLLKENAEHGSYRIEFTYGNKTDYLYIVVG